MNSEIFNGFPAEGIQFLNDLQQNNEREWFNPRKEIYKSKIVQPAIEFVQEMGDRLQLISSGIQYDTRTNGAGSVMRIYRDTRFSKDKTPYKEYVGIVFWEGSNKKNENPGFYLGITGQGAGIHVGMYGFPKPMLAAYRQAVADDKLGAELVEVVTAVQNAGYSISGEHYKRVPRGFAADHPRADWLRYAALHASSQNIPPNIVTSTQFMDVCFDHFEKMAPIQRWLVKVAQTI
ncbi:MAG: DUF2461 domain-containing protein [Chloroflexi bacterium]|nr:DUF2461 domain-containing protein [Chloroflexota bacterium]